VPVIMFAVVFGLSMDYEVFLVSRVREQWIRRRDASAAVADGISPHRAGDQRAAAIMVCVFLSFTLGDERTLKGSASASRSRCSSMPSSFRCVLLPAVLELLGKTTWRLPGWLDARLPAYQHRGLDRPRTARHRTHRSRGTPEPRPTSTKA